MKSGKFDLVLTFAFLCIAKAILPIFYTFRQELKDFM